MKKLIAFTLVLGAATNAFAKCPDVPEWAKQNGINGHFDEQCNFTADGVTFRNDENMWNTTYRGTKSPSYKHDRTVVDNCLLENVIYDGVVREDADEGHDLINPGFDSHLRHFVIKNSVLRGTTHVQGGHEDILQPYRSISDGGWIVIQDSVVKDASENMFMNIGTGQAGYGNAGGGKFKCDDAVMPPGSEPGVVGTGGVLFQGLVFDDNSDGYDGNNQVDIGGPGPGLPEVWLVDTHYKHGLGINFYDTVGKIVVVGGSGGTKGWPGPMKPTRIFGDKMTEANCPAGGWDSKTMTCCPNGRVNVKGEVFSWQVLNGKGIGDNPDNGAIPVFCYDSIEKALEDGHKAPVFLKWSKSGWEKYGSQPDRNPGESEESNDGAGDGADVGPSQPISLSITPDGGVFLQPVAVSIESDATDSIIYYTLDDSEPTEASQVYMGDITIAEQATLKAIAISKDGVKSDILKQEYIFDYFKVRSEWGNLGFVDAKDPVYLSYTYNPSDDLQDVVIGLSSGPVVRFPDLAAMVRFAPSGMIDARNGDTYDASVTLDYIGGGFYQIDMIADLESNVYSAFVKPLGGDRVLVAKDFSFRTEQSEVERLDNLAFVSVSGEGVLSDVHVSSQGFEPEPPRIKNVSVR